MPEFPEGMKHEQFVLRQDPETGMRLVIAVHSTVLGPALGGMRLRAYPGGLSEAMADVLGLARTMTLKASAAGLDLGGGKAVMLDDGRADLRDARMRAAARAVDDLHGAYITAEDIGTTTADMDLMSKHTRWVVGRSRERGGRGDPSPVTAETVLRAMTRGLAAATGSAALEDRTVGVIGVGKVGASLARKLAAAGARVLAFDVDAGRLAELAGAAVVEPVASAEELLARELDVLAPCAAGGAIDEHASCRVVCGAANNPLAGPGTAARLAAKGVLYVPDFLANCGGLINCAAEWSGADDAAVDTHVATAMDRLDDALAEALRTGEPPAAVAERQALERVRRARARPPGGGLAAAA
ncbi:MAG TPA: Glu/Leu/Phe/Val dehydrogenase dimerization domain-containing protein [Thermoleophilaceae bacterium]|nr:Glu/Leu/Phe/Val dehydrogenase dimerization domain-containing protein [Thermoleophilaceae bacterium]